MKKIEKRIENGKYTATIDRITCHYTFNEQKFYFVLGCAEPDESLSTDIYENMGEPNLDYVNIRYTLDNGRVFTHRFFNNKKVYNDMSSFELYENGTCKQFENLDDSIYEIETDVEFCEWLLDKEVTIYIDTYNAPDGKKFYNINARPSKKDSLKGDLDI